MKIELIRYWKTEYKTEEPFILEEDDNFAFYFHFQVASKIGEEKACFKVLFCTPQWIIENERSMEIVSLRHRLIVFEFNLPEMISYVERFIAHIEEKTWAEVVKKIERTAKLEYED